MSKRTLESRRERIGEARSPVRQCGATVRRMGVLVLFACFGCGSSMQRGGCPATVPDVPIARAFSEPESYESRCFRTEVTYVGIWAAESRAAEGEIAVIVSDPKTDVSRIMMVWRADAEKLYELSKGRTLSVRGVMRRISYRRPPYILATSVDVLPDSSRLQDRAGSVVVTPLPASSAGSSPNLQPEQR
jgi:hypothetical protein